MCITHIQLVYPCYSYITVNHISNCGHQAEIFTGSYINRDTLYICMIFYFLLNSVVTIESVFNKQKNINNPRGDALLQDLHIFAIHLHRWSLSTAQHGHRVNQLSFGGLLISFRGG